MPFTKQYFHLRDLQKSGKTPQFGSFKYSAQDLYERGILLSIDQYSPRQFDKIDLVISSNQLGVFSIEMFNNALGITNRMANADVRLEDLLQAQYQDRASLSLFTGQAKFNLNLFLYQINKKWVHYHGSVHASKFVYFSGFMYEYLLLSYHVPLAGCLVSHSPSYFVVDGHSQSLPVRLLLSWNSTNNTQTSYLYFCTSHSRFTKGLSMQ
jgi:RasGAP C-terminus